MKRRAFLKNMAATAVATTAAPSTLLALTGCNTEPKEAKITGFNFDEIIDRTGTYSIKYGRIEKTGADKIGMGIADMDFRTAPFIQEALQTRLKRDVMGYTSTPEEYYTSIINWVKNQLGWQLEREWVSYCPGVITSINLAIDNFSSPGDKVIVQTPVYDPFMNYIKRLEREVAYNPLILENGKYRMNFEQLEELMKDDKTKLMILCNPHNPGGMMWGAEDLKKIAHLAATHGVIILADEIHCDLALYGNKHVPYLSVSEEAAQTGIIFTGPTKTFNLAGVGAAQCYIINPEIREKFFGYMKNRKLVEVHIPTLELTMAGYNNPTDWLEALRHYIEKNVDYVCDFVERELPGIKAYRPEASFLMWLDCNGLGLGEEELMDLFQEKAGILLNNGAHYGPGGEGHVRMNIGCPLSVVKNAMERLKKALS